MVSATARLIFGSTLPLFTNRVLKLIAGLRDRRGYSRFVTGV